MTLVEKAQKVLMFKMNIAKECKKHSVEMPSDEQISEYIKQGCGMNVANFMSDYTEEKGIFYTPPKYSYSPLEQEILDKTLITLKPKELVSLWNTFIEESAIYGEDSHIYDLDDDKDCQYLIEHMTPKEISQAMALATDEKQFIQWIYGSDVKAVEIKGFITAYWGEIIERILLYPSAYNINVVVCCEGDGSTYFDDVVFPIIAKKIGYQIDTQKGTIAKIGCVK